MRLFHKLTALALAAALAASLAGCTAYDNFKEAFFEEAPASDQETVRIGVFEPLTGEDAESAQDEIAGIELAHELYPSVLGTSVELVYEDNLSTLEGSAAAAEALAGQDVRVVLGSYASVLSMAGGDVFQEAGVPAIAATCTNPILTLTNDYYFRVCVVDAYQGNSAAYYVNKYLLQDSAAVLLRNGDEQAEAMATQFIETMASLTGNESAVTKIYLPAEDAEDYSVYLKLLAMTGNTAVFFPSSQSLGRSVLYQESQTPGVDFSWVGTSQWDGIDQAEAGGPDPAEYLGDVSYIMDYDVQAVVTRVSETLSEAYRQKYGEDAVPTEAVALGFDSYLLALDAIRRAGLSADGESIAAELRNTEDFSGATGSITLNAYGDPRKEMTFERYMGDGFGAVYTAPPIGE